MKNLLLILLLAPLFLTAQEYKYSITEQGIDTAAFMLDVRGNDIIIGIGQGSPLVIPFDSITYDLATCKTIAFGHWLVVWDETELVCTEGRLIRFVLTNREKVLIKTKRT
jgi:hypothetical protein